MTIPGVGQLTALAFVAAIDDPSRIRRSRDIGAYLGLVPKRYQSGEVDYVGGISKCGDRRVRTLLYEAANVMLTRYKGQLRLKDWAFSIARRCTDAQGAHRSGASPRDHHARHATRRDGIRRCVDLPVTKIRGDRIELPQRSDAPGREQTTARILSHAANPPADCVFNLAALRPANPVKRQPSAQRTQASQGVENRKSPAP